MPKITEKSRTWRIVHSEASLGWGGQEHRVLAELKGFQQRGAWVALLAPGHSEVFQRAREAGIKVQILDTRKSRYPFTALRLKRWLRVNDVQVVNTHSSRDGYLVGAAARLARVPLLIRSRHIDVDYPNPRISRHAFTTFADHVLTTSEKITGHLKSTFNLQDDHVSTVPTGIDLARFAPDGPKADLFEEGNPDQYPVVGMVSVLRSWKGHSVFLEAAKLLKAQGVKARYVIVGEGPVRESILQKISECNLSVETSLTGYREDIPEVLRALDVLAIPSTGHEGIPQVGLQALACGTPVVGSDAGGIPEIIRTGETGRIVAVGDATQQANAIEVALTEQEDTRRMVENGRRRVEQHHGLEHMLDRLEKIYAIHFGMVRLKDACR
jgi:glycosyltransferase involved in cell wall biosynthesis